MHNQVQKQGGKFGAYVILRVRHGREGLNKQKQKNGASAGNLMR
jgi:hypothetical protein